MQPSNDLLHLLTTAPQYIAKVAAVLTAFVALLGTFRSGALKRVRIGSFELEGIERETAKRIQTELATSEPGAQIPFEIEQLASYYAVTLDKLK